MILNGDAFFLTGSTFENERDCQLGAYHWRREKDEGHLPLILQFQSEVPIWLEQSLVINIVLCCFVKILKYYRPPIRGVERVEKFVNFA